MNPVIFSTLAVEILIVGIIDFKTRKISNWWHLYNLVIALLLFIFLPSNYPFTWNHFIYPLGIFALGFVLFKLKPGGIRIMGGGDAKFLTTLYLAIPTALHELYTLKLLYVVIAVGTILLITSLVKAWRNVLQSILLKSNFMNGVLGKKFPFAPLVIMAWIWMGIEIYIH